MKQNIYDKVKYVPLFSATAQSVQTMIIGRLLAGIGIGISSALVPLYISEVVMFQFIITTVILFFVHFYGCL